MISRRDFGAAVAAAGARPGGRHVRRHLACGGVLLVVILAVASSVGAADLSDQEVLAALTSEPPRARSIRLGLAFLRGRQRPDGALGDPHRTALSAFAVMAHLAAGHTPGDAEHGAWLRRSLDAVLAGQDESGYFGRLDNSRMYGHGIATLVLAEALGTCRDDDLEDRLRRALVRAVAVTVAAARVVKPPEHQGGWRYHPTEGSSDLSLSGWQVMSLHASQQVGVAVPAEVITGAVDYARRLIGPDGSVGYDKTGDDHAALRGLGLLCLGLGHQERSPQAARIADRIRSDPIAWQGPWFFYRAYYEAVGLGRTLPEQWAIYAPRLEQVLISHQAQDGSWPNPPGDNEAGHGPVYATSMAVLALAMRQGLLPAYQR